MALRQWIGLYRPGNPRLCQWHWPDCLPDSLSITTEQRMAEAFVKTMKRDYVSVNRKRPVITP